MEIAEITATCLKQALAAGQQVQPFPHALLELDFVRERGRQSRAEQQIFLQDWLTELIENRLKQYRQFENPLVFQPNPQSRQEITAVLASDFSHNNTELEALSALYHRYLIPISLPVSELAQVAAVVPRQFNRRVQMGLDMLVDLVRREEMAAHGRIHKQQLRRHLPPPDYNQLFGSQPLLQQLTDWFQKENNTSFISIEGLGGIGKTALARAFAEQLAEAAELADILWVSARHEWLNPQGELQPISDPARSLTDIVTRLASQLGQTELAGLAVEDKLNRLQPTLAAAPYLVIIDNLETLADVQLLLPALSILKQSARFLLTSRHTLGHYSFVQRLPVPPLSLVQSRALIEGELERRGRKVTIDQPTMQQLHQLIGGVPLALKLTAAQLAHLPLQDVLQGLQQASYQSSEKLFTYIYHRTWQLLSETAKALLLSLLSISADGENIEWLHLMCPLPEDEFEIALRQLQDYSLIEVSGSSQSPTYNLHRLTITFLQTEILLNWATLS